MTKKLCFILMSLFFLAGCEDSPVAVASPQFADFVNRYESSSKLAEHNTKFAVNSFLQGKWEGKCENIKADKVVIEFLGNTRMTYRYHTPEAPGGSILHGDIYEFLDENTMGTPLRKPEDRSSIKIDKLSDDKIKFSGTVAQDFTFANVSTECVFTKLKD